MSPPPPPQPHRFLSMYSAPPLIFTSTSQFLVPFPTVHSFVASSSSLVTDFSCLLPHNKYVLFNIFPSWPHWSHFARRSRHLSPVLLARSSLPAPSFARSSGNCAHPPHLVLSLLHFLHGADQRHNHPVLCCFWVGRAN